MRQSAGLLLKNNLRDQYAGTAEDFRRYIKVRMAGCRMEPAQTLCTPRVSVLNLWPDLPAGGTGAVRVQLLLA